MNNLIWKFKLTFFFILELLFEDDDMSTKDTPNNRYLLAKSQLRESFPNLFTMLVGKNFISGVDELFELLQNPLLNKQVRQIISLFYLLFKAALLIAYYLLQLVYNLFDAALAELFPELLQSSK